MDTARIVVHYVISLVISLGLVYLIMTMLEVQLEARLVGRPRSPRFIDTFFRRVWIYWLLPGLFSFTGVGLVLFPNSKVQDALRTVTSTELDKEGPYSQAITQMLDINGGSTPVIVAIIVSILLIALARFVIVTYNSALASTIYFYFLGGVGIFGLMMTLDHADIYVKLLVDYLLADKYQTGMILVSVGSIVGFGTEWALANIPLRGYRVGQVPGDGAYVCKTCQKSQYLDARSQLEACQGGRCPDSVFRKVT